MTRPSRRAKNSGERVPPPWKLKPRRTGRSSWKGAPRTAQTATGRAIRRARATGQMAGRMPVACCRRLAWRFHRAVATRPAMKASRAQVWAGCQSSSGSFMPRLQRKARVPRCQACFGRGQALEDGVPEQQLQQQRDVAQGFDVEGGQLGEQPVVRQAADADQGAEDGGQDDADDGDLQGVQDADQQGGAVGVHGGVVGDQRLADGDAGGAAEEAEAGGDVAGGEVVGGVADEIPGDGGDDAEDDDLPDDRTEHRVAPGQPHAAPGGGPNGGEPSGRRWLGTSGGGLPGTLAS